MTTIYFVRHAQSNYKNHDDQTRELTEKGLEDRKLVSKYLKDKNIVIGSHGTALSTIINYFDHTFGYEDFVKIKSLMPWIVKFVFDNDTIQELEMVNLFTIYNSIVS